MQQPDRFEVPSPERLDTFLSTVLGAARNQVSQLIKQGAVTVDGVNAAKPGLKLKAGQEVRVDFPEPERAEAAEVDFDVEVLYEDDDILIVNKPNGLTVHPAPSVKEPTLVDWLKHRGVRLSTLSGEERHGIVHRLDKGTSGVMVVAKNNEAHERLSEQLQDKSMGRYYLAVVTPPLKTPLTYVDRPVGRSAANRLKMAPVEHGKSAQTLFAKLCASFDEKHELIACKLFTGRTHQIRVHLETLSRHILGDHLYALKSKTAKIDRILLHAYLLYLTHPSTGVSMTFRAPVGEGMLSYLTQHFDSECIDAAMDSADFERHFSEFSV